MYDWSNQMQRVIQPTIFYLGTPVVLISTRNEDGTTNLAPMSSAWWLDQSCMLGMSSRSQTVQNLLRERECVLNMPSAQQVAAVDRLARLTGSDPVPPHKQVMGYRHEKHKFAVSGLTAQPSDLVAPPRVLECPIQLEAIVKATHPFGEHDDHTIAIEVEIIRTHIDEALIVPGTTNHIEPDAWRPLIMSFTEFYGLSDRVATSRLAKIYRPASTIA